MPTSFGGSPYSPGPEDQFDYRPGSAITDLILRAGDVRAQQQMRSGDIWGQTVAGLGQMAGQAVGDYQQRKEEEAKQTARSEAIDRLFSSPDPPDPREIIRIYGPKDGADVIKALGALDPTASLSYKDKMEQARDTALGVKAQPAEKRPAAYAFARNRLIANKVFRPEEIPEQYDETFLDLTASYGGGPKKERFSPGEGYLDESGQVQVPIPAAEKPDARSLDARYAEAVASGDQATAQALLQAKGQLEAAGRAPAGPKDERLVQITGPDGVAIWVKESEAVGKPAAQAARGVTGQERTNLGFYNRAKKASDDIAPIEDSISKNAGLISQAQLGYEGIGSNLIKTAEQQAYRQAQRAFTEARLRKESGAAIPKEEFTSDAQTYFAQPGDSPAVIDQKRAARAVVLDGLRFSSGRAYDEYYGEPAPKGGGGGSGLTPEAQALQAQIQARLAGK